VQVDRELRHSFCSQIPKAVRSIAEGQTEFIKNQMSKISLDDIDERGGEWEHLEVSKLTSRNCYNHPHPLLTNPLTRSVRSAQKNSSVFVKLYKKTSNQQLWGKAQATVDSSAQEVLAWLWDYCSNERLQAQKNLHANPRDIVKTISPMEQYITAIKTLPWPLSPRQVNSHAAWAELSKDTYVLAWDQPAPGEVHIDNIMMPQYAGRRKKLVSGTTQGYCVLKNVVGVGREQCDLKWVQNMTFGGVVRSSIANKQLLPRMMKLVFQVRDAFERDVEIDQMERTRLMKIMEGAASTSASPTTTARLRNLNFSFEASANEEIEIYTAQEDTLVNSISKTMEVIASRKFVRFPYSKDYRTYMGKNHVEGDKVAYLKVETDVDASIEECAAYNFMILSRKRMKLNDQESIKTREARSYNNHCCDMLLLDDIGYGLRRRIFLTRHIWKRISNKQIVHVNKDVDESKLFPECASIKNNVVVGKTSGYLSYVDSTITGSSINSTKMMYVVRLDLGGLIPKKFLEFSAMEFLSDYSVMRKAFCKDYEIDLEQRGYIKENLAIGKRSKYTKVENFEIENARNLFLEFSNCKDKTTIKVDDEMITGHAANINGKTWVHLNLSVRCKGEDLLAFLLNVESRTLMSHNDDLKETVSEYGRLDELDKGFNNGGHIKVVNVIENGHHLFGSRFTTRKTRRLVWKEFCSKNSGGTNTPQFLLSATPTNIKQFQQQHQDGHQKPRKSASLSAANFFKKNKALEIVDKTR